MEKNPSLFRAIIMDHYQYPRNRKEIDNDEYLACRMSSSTCADDFKIQLKVENDIIEDIAYSGVGCTISTSALSVMSELLIGKTIGEAKYIIEQYMLMMKQEAYDDSVLLESICFEGVSKQANRIQCATLGYQAIEKMIHEMEEKWKEK